jgi:hypothetical protein
MPGEGAPRNLGCLGAGRRFSEFRVDEAPVAGKAATARRDRYEGFFRTTGCDITQGSGQPHFLHGAHRVERDGDQLSPDGKRRKHDIPCELNTVQDTE